MANTLGTILKWGALAGAGYLAYEYFFATPAAASTSTTGGTSTTTTTTTAAPPASSYNTPTALLARITSAAQADGLSATSTVSPDVWDTYFNSQGGQQMAGGPPPDPVSVFGSHDPITLAQYWAGISQWLATTKGLTGLGIYYGLGRIAGLVR